MELVNHPNHYNLPNRKECIVEMKENYGTRIVAVFCLTNAYKYLYRAGNKDGTPESQDIEKARWYVNWAKQHESSITGPSFIKLYRDVQKELKKYDKS